MPRGIIDPERRRVVWEAVGLADAMLFLGVSRSTIDRMVKAETLNPFRTDGGHRRFKVAELRRIRDSRRRVKPRQTRS